MNKYYSKCTKRNNNGFANKQHNYKKNNYYKRNQYNTYINYNKRKKIAYDAYEEEIPYEETTLSTNDPSTKDGSFSQSSSNSRKHSFNEYNNEYYNGNWDKNKDSSLLILDDNSKNNNTIPKINLSEDVLKTAFYKPKNFKENTCPKNEIKKIEDSDNNDNITILEINVKISKDKYIYFKLRKYDDMFQVVKDTCKKNEMSEEYVYFFISKIIKALNSIYGIYNLNLKDEEKKILNNLKKKYSDN